MEDFPFSYQRIASPTWAYLSSLLLLALFFKFNRFWSIRNFDLLLIILLAPGLMMIEGGRAMVDRPDDPAATATLEPGSEGIAPPASVLPAAADELAEDDGLDAPGYAWQRLGYYWLFLVGLLLLLRLLLDPALTRRPLLEPNLSQGGLFFFTASLLFFLGANVLLSSPTAEDVQGARNAIKLLQREAAQPVDREQLQRRGPGYSFFYVFPILPTFENGNEIMNTDADELENTRRYIIAAKVLALVSQALIVLGLILFCQINFNSLGIGVGAAAIYLMLPYTAMFTGHVMHALPAALMVWALVCFRRPVLSGLLIGLATTVAYYPFFLLPLWASFYWERGVRRFLLGVVIALGIGIAGLIFTSVDGADFLEQLKAMFGFWSPRMEGLEGIWALGWDNWWRLPILVAFVAFSVSFVAWPTQKNLGTLIAYTAAIMVTVQFWHGYGGGRNMAWYLPFLLLVIFRPNLSGRVATTELRLRRQPRTDPTEEILSGTAS